MTQGFDLHEPKMDGYVCRAAADMEAARDELRAAIAEIRPGDWDRLVPYGRADAA